MSTGSFRTRRTRGFSTRQRENSASRRRKSWSRLTSTPIHPQHRSRLRSTRRSRTAESNAGTLLCLKRWVVALHGGPQRSDIDKVQEFAKLSNCRHERILLRLCIDDGGPRRKRGERLMADLGIARVTNEADANGTLTRADLADVVHRKLGLSRAESAGVVERVLHHMCHALSEGANVKVSGFGTFILRDKGERVGRNPKTGVEVPIAPLRVMTFRASQIMRDRIAKG